MGLLDLFSDPETDNQQLDPNSLLGSFGSPGWTNKQARDSFWGNVSRAGFAMLAANQPGVSMGQALGAGGMAFSDGIQAGKQQALQDQMMGMRMDAMRQQQEQAKTRQQSIQALTQQYPHLAPLFALDPSKAADVMANAMKPRDPKEGFMEVNGQLFDVRGGTPQAVAGRPKPITVGNTLVDPETMRPVFTAPHQYAPTDLQRNMAAAGIDPRSPEGQSIIRSNLTSSEPLVSVMGPSGPVYAPRSQAIGKTPYDANMPLQTQGNSMVTGDAFLSSLDPQLAAQVKGIAEGRLPYPTGMYLRTPQGQAIANAVNQYDPNMNASDYQARAGTLKDFTSGQAARNVTSLNTVMGHLDALNEAGKKLNNGRFTYLNQAENAVADAMGDPSVKTYKLTANAVADELEKAFRGTGGSLEGIRSWKAQIDTANSPEQMKAIVNQGIELLDSRINALGEQYNRGMKTNRDAFELLNPKEREIYQRLKGGSHGGTATASGWGIKQKGGN